jgi:hypothetical protein
VGASAAALSTSPESRAAVKARSDTVLSSALCIRAWSKKRAASPLLPSLSAASPARNMP